MKPFVAVLLSALALPLSALASASELVHIRTGAEVRDAAPLSPTVRRSVPVLAVAELDLRAAAAVRIDVFGTPVLAEREQVQVRSGGWTWEGHGEDGSWLLLSYQEGRLAGNIDIAGQEFEIVPQAGGGSALIERDLARLAPYGEPLDPPLPAQPPSPLPPDLHALRDGIHWIDVMIVYTSQVATQAGGHAGVAARAHNDVAWTNRALYNTRVPARFRLVAVKRMTLAEDDDMDDMLPAARADEKVKDWRDRYGADMVGVYVSQGQYCGLGYVMRNPGPSFADAALQLTRFDCGAATYAHEHGHNMGMEHNPEDSSLAPPQTPSYDWSFGYGVADGSNSFRTIMAYSSVCGGNSPCTRVRAFSAPGWYINGHEIGVANSRDNSRTAGLTAALVASFRSSVMLFQNGFD